MTDHFLRSYDDELSSLRTMVSQMGGMAEDQLVHAMQAIRERDNTLAERVIAGDRMLDELERMAEQASMAMLARRAPLADDLREIVSALKMTTLIERMGDHSKNIARRGRDIIADSQVDMLPIVESMAQEAQTMVGKVMDAYVRRDADAALAVWEQDEALDSMHGAAFRQIIGAMVERPENMNIMTHMLMISKNLERIGDQATNVAEHVYYAITGEELELSRPKGT